MFRKMCYAEHRLCFSDDVAWTFGVGAAYVYQPCQSSRLKAIVWGAFNDRPVVQTRQLLVLGRRTTEFGRPNSELLFALRTLSEL